MSSLFILALALPMIPKGCPEPKFINKTEFPRNDLDNWTLGNAQKGCERNFGPKACLAKLYKVKERGYHATCLRNGRK